MKQVPVLKIMGNKEKTRELPDLYSEKVYVVYYDVIISNIFSLARRICTKLIIGWRWWKGLDAIVKKIELQIKPLHIT